MKPLYQTLSAAVLATTLIACSDTDPVPLDNLVETAQEDGSFTTLVAALQASGLDAVLADESQEFTVFAPTDAAFEALLTDLGISAADLLASPYLSDILLYHVVPNARIDSAAAINAAGTTVTTANEDDIGIGLKGADLFINASRVEKPDIETNNGIIHVIDAVLVPTEDDATSGTIAAVATANGSFNTLVGALGATGLDAVLADANGKFTVFAPTDAAFAKIDTSGLTNDELKDILLYHVIVGAEINAAAATAIAGNTVKMGNDDNMALSLSNTELFANLSKIALPNVDASNGIIHAVDTVLLPPAPDTRTTNIVETAQGNPDFSTLVDALSATSDLVAELSDPNKDFTVFAPTNAAFDALEASNPGIIANLLATPDGTLRDILLKHVVTGSVDSVTAFTLNGAAVPTVNGETVEIAIDSGVFTVDGAQVTTFDIVTTNGVIHVIDAVILLD
jgi:uncharacterized surface protein with fasciclin (FAS1) repeats